MAAVGDFPPHYGVVRNDPPAVARRWGLPSREILLQVAGVTVVALFVIGTLAMLAGEILDDLRLTLVGLCCFTAGCALAHYFPEIEHPRLPAPPPARVPEPVLESDTESEESVELPPAYNDTLPPPPYEPPPSFGPLATRPLEFLRLPGHSSDLL